MFRTEGPMFRRFYVQKVLCSEGPRLCSESFVHMVLCSESTGDNCVCYNWAQDVFATLKLNATSMTLIQCRKNVCVLSEFPTFNRSRGLRSNVTWIQMRNGAYSLVLGTKTKCILKSK